MTIVLKNNVSSTPTTPISASDTGPATAAFAFGSGPQTANVINARQNS